VLGFGIKLDNNEFMLFGLLEFPLVEQSLKGSHFYGFLAEGYSAYHLTNIHFFGSKEYACVPDLSQFPLYVNSDAGTQTVQLAYDRATYESECSNSAHRMKVSGEPSFVTASNYELVINPT